MKAEINRSSDILWTLGDVKIEIVAYPGFNAFAHCDDKKEGIAVCSGLFSY